jgi:hypothetical protein
MSGKVSHLITRRAQRWLDKHARSPRLFGFTVDDGMPDRGERYGGAQTIHNTGTIDVVLDDGHVTEVWFRCVQLAFRVSEPKGTHVYDGEGERLVAVELEARAP